MSLKEIASDLRIVAKEHPYDALAVHGTLPAPRHHRELVVDGVPILLVFTLTVIGPRKLWQLSFQHKRGEPLPDEIVDQVLAAFFCSEFCEIPSVLHRGTVRQFVQEA